METNVGGFEGLTERYCAIKSGCFSMDSGVFESLLNGEKE